MPAYQSATFDAAAGRLLALYADTLPDLSRVRVLVPHHHVIRPFLLALRGRVTDGVFLPPRLTTLPGLAAAAPTGPGQSDAARLVELHAFLCRVDWLEAAARWPVARALLDLLNDMDDALLTPPADYAEFARQVAGLGRRVLARPLEVETRLAFDVWRAFHAGAPGPRAAYAAALGHWLAHPDGPVHALGLAGLGALERRFLDALPLPPEVRDLPLEHPYPARAACLAAAWHGEGAPGERAAAQAARQADSPLGGSLELAPAPDLEAQVRLAATRLRAWLAEGRRHLAVVALDRLAARRLRAVLERDGILMQDETGWTFSTAAVSHVLDRWLDLLENDGYHRDLLDLLKSPFLFADLDPAARQMAVAALERRLNEARLVSGLQRILDRLPPGGPASARPLLERLVLAARGFSGTCPLAVWQQRLLAALDTLGATAACAADPVGGQLLDLLRRLARELAGDRVPHDFASWRAWLTLQLDTHTFVDAGVESPLRLTHLAAARLRDFQGVVILGADAGHLPQAAADGLFSDAARRELGLPGQAQARAEALAALTDVLGRSETVLVTWQAESDGGPNPPSPWLESLELFHRLAYGRSLLRAARSEPPPRLTDLPGTPPAPRLTALPDRLSASAWQTLVDCPYRYFARYGLGLWEETVLSEEMEKRDYGQLVHMALASFHARHPCLAAVDRAVLLADLGAASREAFADWLERYALAEAWWRRWERRLAAYLDWALAREAKGYRWQAAEQAYARQLPLPDGGRVTLEGRLDRLDQGPAGPAVLDYKTQSRQTLRRMLGDPGEAVQLPFYGVLTGAAEAAFVALDEDQPEDLGLAEPLPMLAEREATRLAATLAEVAAGAPLPAQGAPETCARCEMAGLCRQGHR